MSVPQVTIVGDVHVEHFRPVRERSASLYGDDVQVFRSDEGTDGLRTESPGGAAFLTYLLRRAGVKIQALLPAQPDWEVIRFVTNVKGPGKPPSLLQIAHPKYENRVESLYANVVNEKLAPPRWKLRLRLEERHKPISCQAASAAAKADTLIVDDYGRNAITRKTLEQVADHTPQLLIVSAQAGGKERYKNLPQVAETIIIVASVRLSNGWVTT